MSKSNPKITVLIAVHNGEQYIRETLDSIKNQTFKDFECLLINDFSTDSTLSILEEYAKQDDRFVIHNNEVNLRLAKSLNVGLELARGKYIARLDADDISLPQRLEKQYEYMENHPEISLSYCKHFILNNGMVHIANSGKNRSIGGIPASFLFFCPVLHPGVIVKTDVIRKYKYNPEHTCSEDMELWSRMIMGGEKIACQSEFLVLYRIHDSQITSGSSEKQKNEVISIFSKYYQFNFGHDLDEYIDFLSKGVYFYEERDINKLCKFYKALLKANKKAKKFKKINLTLGFTEILMAYNYKKHFTVSEWFKLLRVLKGYFILFHYNWLARYIRDIFISANAAKNNNFKFTKRIHYFAPYYKYKK